MGFFNFVMKNLGIQEIDDTNAKEKIRTQVYENDDTTKKVNNPKEVQNTDSVAIICPRFFQDVVDLVDFIAGGRTAVVDFNELATSSAERSIDFLSGAVFALKGSMEKVSEGLYLYAPQGVRLVKPTERRKK